ncbi:MAG: hypothetical protein II691_01145, partial [Muribaculaceae bacterium]|nr:hypothetical protein [Muribaculaceae bacterium]
RGTLYIADTLVNENPDTETLIDIAKLASKSVKFFNEKPVIGMISHSNFGSSQSDGALKVALSSCGHVRNVCVCRVPRPYRSQVWSADSRQCSSG